MFNSSAVYDVDPQTSGLKFKLQEDEADDDYLLKFALLTRQLGPPVFSLLNIGLLAALLVCLHRAGSSPIAPSLLLSAALFHQSPISKLTYQQACPSGFQAVPLYGLAEVQQQLAGWATFWRKGQSFCVKRLGARDYYPREDSCKPSELECGDYCLINYQKCPITELRPTTQATEGEALRLGARLWLEVHRSSSGPPLSNVAVLFRGGCADEFFYQAQYSSARQFERVLAQPCAEELTVPLTKIDEIPGEEFAQLNLRNSRQFFGHPAVLYSTRHVAGGTCFNSSTFELLMAAREERSQLGGLIYRLIVAGLIFFCLILLGLVSFLIWEQLFWYRRLYFWLLALAQLITLLSGEQGLDAGLSFASCGDPRLGVSQQQIAAHDTLLKLANFNGTFLLLLLSTETILYFRNEYYN